MIRLFAIVCIILSCTFFGFMIDRRVFVRYRSISYLISALLNLKTNIVFSDLELKRALCESDKGLKDGNIMRKTADLMNDFSVAKAWDMAVRENAKELSLYDSDLDAVIPIGKKLGMSDVKTQAEHLDNAIQALKIKEEEAREEYQKRNRFAAKFGFLVAMFIIFLLI